MNVEWNQEKLHTAEVARVVLIRSPLTGKAYTQQMAILAVSALILHCWEDRRRAQVPSIELQAPQQLLETCAVLGK